MKQYSDGEFESSRRDVCICRFALIVMASCFSVATCLCCVVFLFFLWYDLELFVLAVGLAAEHQTECENRLWTYAQKCA